MSEVDDACVVLAYSMSSSSSLSSTDSKTETTTTTRTSAQENAASILRAAGLLKENEVVAFPTETVYGLGANCFSDQAVSKIFKAKGRPSDNPLIVHIYDRKQVLELAEAKDVPEYAKSLMEQFWPGSLTLVLPVRKTDNRISSLVTCGLDTVGIRMPNHQCALDLLEACGVPLAAPSANTSGKPSPTTAQHVVHDLSTRIPAVVDGGATQCGLESTVLDCSIASSSSSSSTSEHAPHPCVILRPGAVTREMIESVIGEISSLTNPKSPPSTSSSSSSSSQPVVADGPKAPGMKYTHYAPKAPLVLLPSGQADASINDLSAALEQHAGERVGLLCSSELLVECKSRELLVDAMHVINLGTREDLHSVARGLYAGLRAFDDVDPPVDVILAESFPRDGFGAAIMNRLSKAASKK